MNTLDIVRAWKDEEYRMSLNSTDRASLPANPAGVIELENEDLTAIHGGGAAYVPVRPKTSFEVGCTFACNCSLFCCASISL